MGGTNPVSGNPISDLTLPNSWSDYVRTTDYSPADVASKAIQGFGFSPAPRETEYAPGTPWGMPTVFIRDTLRASVEAATGGLVTILYDQGGNASYMRVIPKFRCEDIHADLGTGVHPAFIVGGIEKSYIFVGIVPASVGVDGMAVSIPGNDPWATVDFDAARAACTLKGSGWHLMTNWEWAAIALLCLKNGFQPRGNTNWGGAHDAAWETAPRYDGAAPFSTQGTARTKGGLGPASWRHDNTTAGIADLVGNVWEWQDGMKLVDGQIWMPNDNAFGLAEGSWTPQGAYFESTGTTGTDTNPSENGAPTLSATRNTPSDDCGNGLGVNAPDYDYASIWGESGWRSMGATAGYDSIALATRQRLMRALIAPKISSGASVPFATKGLIAARNYGERIPYRGGSWDRTSGSGLGALCLDARRSHVLTSFGFRPAFIGV
jgi:hypothetical protein